MSLPIVLAGIIAVLLALSVWVGILARTKTHQLECITKFYELAPGLIADERVPDSLVGILSGISRSIDHRRVAYHLFGLWFRGELGKNGNRTGRAEFFDTMNSLPQDVRKRMSTAFAYAIIAATYSAPFIGAILRRALFSPVGMPQRTEDAPHFTYDAIIDCPKDTHLAAA